MNWKFWKSDGRKSKTREWIDALIFAVIATTIIRTFLIEAFTIPTPSMEKSLLVGDFLFVSKINYGARTPMTPLSFPFAHQELPIMGGSRIQKQSSCLITDCRVFLKLKTMILLYLTIRWKTIIL